MSTSISRGGSRILEAVVLTWTFICVAKKSDNWLIQCASHTPPCRACSIQSLALSRGSGGIPTGKLGLLTLVILSET